MGTSSTIDDAPGRPAKARVERARFYLNKIREELNPAEFSFQEFKEEYGRLGGEDTGAPPGSTVPPESIIGTLLEIGDIESIGPNTYKVVAEDDSDEDFDDEDEDDGEE